MNHLILKLLIVLLPFYMPLLLEAQAPNKINYQGIARNGDGSPLGNKSLTLRLSILDGLPNGGSLYTETHNQTTNAFGLYSLGVGTGAVVSGSFTTINWASGDKFLKIELDPNGGNNFIEMGTSQLLSVPLALYANHSGNAANATNAINAANAVNSTTAATANALAPSAIISPHQISGTGATVGQILKWDGSKWIPKNDSLGGSGTSDNWGTQSVSTDATLSGNGTLSNQLKLASQGAMNGQTLKWNGISWIPSNDNIFDGDSSLMNEIQTLSKSGDSIILSKSGGFAIDNQSWTISQTTHSKANSKSNNQYVTGNVGIGDFSTSNPGANLHVLGRSLVETSVDIGTGNLNAGSKTQVIGINNHMSTYADHSAIIGRLNYTEGDNVLSIGTNDTIYGENSTTIGLKNVLHTNAYNSLAVGKENFANAFSTTVFGEGNKGVSYGETSLGLFGTNYTAGSHNSFVATDRIFNIGNGSSTASRSDALTLLKNGNLGLGISSPNTKLHIQGNGHTKELIASIDSSAYLSLSSPWTNAMDAGIEFSTFTGGSHKSRWKIRKAGNELANNMGGNLEFESYNDAGQLLHRPLTISRSSGYVSMKYAIIDTVDSWLTMINQLRYSNATCSVGTTPFSTTITSGHTLIFTGTNSGRTITLPVNPIQGRLITILNHSTQNLNISPAFIISSGTTTNFITPGTNLQLIYDGIDWRKMN